MTQKQTLFKGQSKKKTIPPNRHGKAPHVRKGKRAVKPTNRHCLVHPSCIYLLLAVGEDRSFHLPDTESCCLGAMWRQLLIETVTLI
uniref:Uncharacterized protein n=1 Tax=Zea mays TaxID=4577 RepID=B6U7G6_MAIZE|nr:hypothetical protein [Zea mays]